MSITIELDGHGRMRRRMTDRATTRATFTPFFKVVSNTSFSEGGTRTVLLTFVGLDSEVQIEMSGDVAHELAQEVLK